MPGFDTILDNRRQKRFFQQHLFLAGAITGLLLGVVLTTISEVVLNALHSVPQSAQHTHAGNMIITIDDSLLSASIRQSLQQDQKNLPFPISNVSAQTQPGNHIDLTVKIPTAAGVTANARFGLSPTINSIGHLDFKVVSVNLGGIDVGIVASGIIENALNQQFASYSQGKLVHGLNYQLVGVSTTNNALIVTVHLTFTS